MILEVDAGNTFIKWRYRDDEGCVTERGRWLTRNFCATDLADCMAVPRQVLAGSVAGGEFERQFEQAIVDRWGVSVRFARTAALAAGVRNSYSDPARMGVDRWLVLLAAWQQCQEACCIVDCGSAITVDLLSATGEHQGGYILPGLRLMRQVLTGATAGILVDREITDFSTRPGCDTSSAVVHGTNLMFSALAQMLPDWLAAQQRDGRLLVTGGDGELFCELMGSGELHPDLVMDGLRWALE